MEASGGCIPVVRILSEAVEYSCCWHEAMDKVAMRRFFQVNGDIFFRTLCLVAVTTFFTSTGARQGDIVLAVNTLLMQLFTLFSYIMRSFAYAGEALAGRYIGARNKTALSRMIRLLFGWGLGCPFRLPCFME